MRNPFYLVYLAVLLLCFFTGWGYSRYLNRPFLLILAQVTMACIAETLSQTVMKQNNAILFNCYILPELWIDGIALSILLTGRRSGLFTTALVLATAIWLLNLIFAGTIVFANYAYLLGGLLLGIASILTIIKNLQKGILPFQHRSVAFLLAGLAVYYVCNVPVLSLLMGAFISRPVGLQLFAINLLLASLKYALISFAFIQRRNELKYSRNNSPHLS